MDNENRETEVEKFFIPPSIEAGNNKIFDMIDQLKDVLREKQLEFEKDIIERNAEIKDKIYRQSDKLVYSVMRAIKIGSIVNLILVVFVMISILILYFIDI